MRWLFSGQQLLLDPFHDVQISRHSILPTTTKTI
jgi:hypothetical protein